MSQRAHWELRRADKSRVTVTEPTADRIRASLVGLCVVFLAVPPILRIWAPAWFIWAWLVTYAAGMALFIFMRLRSSSPRIEYAWAVVTSSLFGLIPLSTIWFDAPAEGKWAAGATAAFAIANEIASRTNVAFGDWRLPPLITTLALSVAALVEVGWGVGIGVFLACFMLIHNAEGVRAEEEEIRYERSHDELTGLLNRRGLVDELIAMRQGRLTIAMVDADRFKMINDTYGYLAGDAMLIAMGDALRKRLGPEWSLARQGGDEFVAVAPGWIDVPDNLVESVRCSLPYRSGDIEIMVDLSAGVAYSSDAMEPDHLMSRAGFALRVAKRGGGISRFESRVEEHFRQALEIGKSDELAADALFGVAQPIVAEDAEIVGFELLARWRGSDDVVMAPDAFLPMLAENGLMPQLNDRMLETGIRFASRFNNRPAAPFVSVNVTASHLASPTLVPLVRSLLEQHRVSPERLMIEITESEGLEALARWRQTARTLVGMGVMLAIDDFGSGYSSIERMNLLPITHLKFDKSFTTTVDGPFGNVARGIAEFASATGLGVIAEGIETLDEFESMRRIGVQFFQGFGFGTPVALDEAERSLIARSEGPQNRAEDANILRPVQDGFST